MDLSGPHFYLGTPFNKSPRAECRHNQDYDEIDLGAIADDYLPRTNFARARSPAEYLRRTPTFKGRSVTGSIAMYTGRCLRLPASALA